MVEQNLQSWFLHTSLPSPHVIFLNKGKFPGTSLVAPMVKNLPAMQETQVRFLGQEDLWRREWQPTLVFLPEEFHRQRSLVGSSP